MLITALNMLSYTREEQNSWLSATGEQGSTCAHWQTLYVRELVRPCLILTVTFNKNQRWSLILRNYADKSKSLHWSSENGNVLEWLKDLVTAEQGLLLVGSSCCLQQLHQHCQYPNNLIHYSSTCAPMPSMYSYGIGLWDETQEITGKIERK